MEDNQLNEVILEQPKPLIQYDQCPSKKGRQDTKTDAQRGECCVIWGRDYSGTCVGQKQKQTNKSW